MVHTEYIDKLIQTKESSRAQSEKTKLKLKKEIEILTEIKDKLTSKPETPKVETPKVETPKVETAKPKPKPEASTSKSVLNGYDEFMNDIKDSVIKELTVELGKTPTHQQVNARVKEYWNTNDIIKAAYNKETPSTPIPIPKKTETVKLMPPPPVVSKAKQVRKPKLNAGDNQPKITLFATK